MTHEEKLQSQPEDTTNHEQLDKLNRAVADKLSQLRDAGVDVDSRHTGVSDPATRARVRSLVLGLREDVSPVVSSQNNKADQRHE